MCWSRRAIRWRRGSRCSDGAAALGQHPSKLFIQAGYSWTRSRRCWHSGLMPDACSWRSPRACCFAHSDAVDARLRALREISVAVHLDNFGTGYWSLSYLQRYPGRCVEAGRSFVARMGTHGNDVVGGAIVKLARELGMGIIAEGVETGSARRATDGPRLSARAGLSVLGPLTASAMRADAGEAVLAAPRQRLVDVVSGFSRDLRPSATARAARRDRDPSLG